MLINDEKCKKHDSSKKRINCGYRFNRKEAIELLKDIPMGELMEMAYASRCLRFPGGYVSFVLDTNPNYTNICITGCTFCAFHRGINDPGSYVLTPKEIAYKVKNAETKGATTVLLQGGHNPYIFLKDWLSYLDEIRLETPNIHIHPFSPSEYLFMAEQENVSVEYILKTLWEYGITTMPGGGAEILSEGVRKIISPKKSSVQDWLKTTEIAHKIGFKSTATMMFGHIEGHTDIIDHFLKLRELQDLTGGFTSFIPWSFKPLNTELGSKIKDQIYSNKYVRIIAVARLILDNFQHIQSSWFSESFTAGQLGLLAGADDFGGILIEENVHKEAGHVRLASVDNVIAAIRKSGFIPVQRDSNYKIIKSYDR